jgi:NADH:ubiquinone oxidoreductase subunit E
VTFLKGLRTILLLTTAVAALLLAASTTLLIWDYFEACQRQPVDKKTLETLERAAHEDVSYVPHLTAEYNRQTEASLARRDRNDLYTNCVIVSAIVFLVSAKWLLSLKRRSVPTLAQIEAHREVSSGSWFRWQHLRAPVNPTVQVDAPEIDLTFVDRVVAEEGRSKEAAIVILQRIQRHYRFLPDDALRRVCELTEISPAQIAGVSTFYAQFRRSPAGMYIIKVCHGTACHVAGATEITDEIRRHLQIALDSDTDPQRIFTVDKVACLGCCSLSPVLMIEDETVGSLSPASASVAIERYRQERHA